MRDVAIVIAVAAALGVHHVYERVKNSKARVRKAANKAWKLAQEEMETWAIVSLD